MYFTALHCTVHNVCTVHVYYFTQQGRIWGGSERRWNPLVSTGGPEEPPVDLGQKTFFKFLFRQIESLLR